MKSVLDGLVIRVSDYGENDMILTILSAKHGKISMIVKGAYSPRSKLLHMCRVFNYVNMEYYQKNGKRWLSGGEVTQSFKKIDKDIGSFALASYIVQLASEITGEGVPCEDVLRMTLNALYAIENKIKPLYVIKSAYEILACGVFGVSPDVSHCAECEREHSEEGWWLDVMNGRVVCARCLAERGRIENTPSADELLTRNILLPMTDSAIAAWRYVDLADSKRIFSFSLKDKESVENLERASEEYIVNHLERGFDTLEFYHAVKD